MPDKRCSQCSRWRYNKGTEEKYGMGVGFCTFEGEAKFCDGKVCWGFVKRQEEKK